MNITLIINLKNVGTFGWKKNNRNCWSTQNLCELNSLFQIIVNKFLRSIQWNCSNAKSMSCCHSKWHWLKGNRSICSWRECRVKRATDKRTKMIFNESSLSINIRYRCYAVAKIPNRIINIKKSFADLLISYKRIHLSDIGRWQLWSRYWMFALTTLYNQQRIMGFALLLNNSPTNLPKKVFY